MKKAISFGLIMAMVLLGSAGVCVFAEEPSTIGTEGYMAIEEGSLDVSEGSVPEQDPQSIGYEISHHSVLVELYAERFTNRCQGDGCQGDGSLDTRPGDVI